MTEKYEDIVTVRLCCRISIKKLSAQGKAQAQTYVITDITMKAK